MPLVPTLMVHSTVGRYECAVCEGYTDFSGACQDVHECDNSLYDANGGYSNTDRGFECECNAWFYGTGESCEDINECALARNT